MAENTQIVDVYAQIQSQQAALIMAHQQLLQQHREIEYFHVYVAESEVSNVAHWIELESNKTLSLNNLRSFYATCFGIKYKFLDTKGELKTNYARYHNGFFRFPMGLDMNKTRFIAFYYSDHSDVKAYMDLADVNATCPELAPNMLPISNSSFVEQSHVNFDMHKILLRGAQSTPKMNVPLPSENVSSTSDVILNEPPIDVITINESNSILPLPPHHILSPPKSRENLNPKSASTCVSAKPVQTVTSTSNVEHREKELLEKKKHEPITFDDSSKRESSSVKIRVAASSKGKELLHRCKLKQFKGQGLDNRTPLKITLKSCSNRGKNNLGKREILADPKKKIVKIEDKNGRTTALITKRRLAAKFETENIKKRVPLNLRSFNRNKTIKYEEQPCYKQISSPVNTHNQNFYRVLNVLLVGFNSNKPVIRDTNSYFSEFGIVTDLQLYVVENRYNIPEFYAYMKIRTDDTLSLFSDRHLYNGAVIYAIRVDGAGLPQRLNCKTCGYQGINTNYVHYHLEGHYHQTQLQKQLDSLTNASAYRDIYYRITADELYVQFPVNAVEGYDNRWKRSNYSSPYSAKVAPAGHFYDYDNQRY